ncbi:MAG: hypothetical protein P8Y99_03295 [Calditrichaceae bacterium]
MCDLMVALPDVTKNHRTVFGKNSDCPAGECQILYYSDDLKEKLLESMKEQDLLNGDKSPAKLHKFPALININKSQFFEELKRAPYAKFLSDKP